MYQASFFSDEMAKSSELNGCAKCAKSTDVIATYFLASAEWTVFLNFSFSHRSIRMKTILDRIGFFFLSIALFAAVPN